MQLSDLHGHIAWTASLPGTEPAYTTAPMWLDSTNAVRAMPDGVVAIDLATGAYTATAGWASSSLARHTRQARSPRSMRTRSR